MKSKFLLLLCVAFSVYTVSAQFTIAGEGGEPIEDGGLYGVADNTVPDGYLSFFVTNTSETEDISMRVEFVSTTNTGDEFQICFGLCYEPVVVGQSYPPNGGEPIAAGATTGEGNHLFNFGATESGAPLDYVVRFYTIDENDNEIGEDLTITYRYDPALGLEEVESLGLSVESTLVKNTINIDSQKNLDLAIYDLQGKSVQSRKIVQGSNNLDVAALRSGLYLLTFSDENGSSETVKVVKQ